LLIYSREMSNEYKLSTVVQGHSMDVKSVSACSEPALALLTASRDKTARLWYRGAEGSYSQRKVYRGHAKYVSAAVFVEPTEEFPSGLIYTGCQDSKIRAFLPDVEDPLFLLEGHAENVVSLTLGKFGTLVSGSWDCTAKVWLNRKVSMTLTGHTAAVWATGILPEVGVMVTGSADKTVRLWKAGAQTHCLQGHTDAVRDIAVIDKGHFLSASNDATVRRWSVEKGECLDTYYGHTNYIYSISLIPGASPGSAWVTGGEDRSMRVWEGGEIKQTIYLPAISVWSVCALANGDVCAATNDGLVRVFTREESRVASSEVIQAFEAELSACAVAAEQELGGIKVTDLPGPEALYEPGARDGQQKMVREGEKVSVHSWSMSAQKWEKIGDVVGAAGGTEKTSGKKLYKGKEYDFVFDIEIDEPKMTLKLPFNTSDDPFMAAQTFIHTHGLSQYYLEEIANHIIKNTGGATLGTGLVNCDPLTGGASYSSEGISGGTVGSASALNGVADPFTGGGAYVSGSGAGLPSAGAAPGGGTPDPWMQGAYRTEGYSSGQMEVDDSPPNTFFPHKEFLKFSGPIKMEPLLSKLQEFNSVQPPEKQVDGQVLPKLASLITPDPDLVAVKILVDILKSFPDNSLFPALDLARLAVFNPKLESDLLEKDNLDSIYSTCLRLMDKDAPIPCQMLSLRLLSNLCSTEKGEILLRTYMESLVNRVLVQLLPIKDKNKNIEIAVSTLLLNLVVSFSSNLDSEALTQLLTPLGLHFLEQINDWEARFRVLVAIGTILATVADSKEFAKAMDVKESVRGWRILEGPQKVSECARFIENML